MRLRIGVPLANIMFWLLFSVNQLLAHGEDNNPTTVTRSDWLAQIPLILVMIVVVLFINYLFIARIRKADR